MADCCKCNSSFTNAGEGIKCNKCAGLFHASCTRLGTIDKFKKMNSQARSAWKCDECIYGSDNTSIDAKLNKILDSITELRTELINLFEPKIVALKTDVDSLKKSSEETKLKFDKLSTDRDEKYIKLETAIAELEKSNSQLREEVNFLQQRSRIENLEIGGLPRTEKENIYEILGAVAKLIGVSFKQEDIAIAHRVPNARGGSNIIVKFVARRVKISWLEAAKKKKDINAIDLGLGLPGSSVYINDHLSPYNKQLLGKAKELKKRGKLEFVWVKSGKIFVRRDAASPAKQIVREASLEKLSQG